MGTDEDSCDDREPVVELGFDDRFREHLQDRGRYEKHRISEREIAEVFENAPQFFINARGEGRRAPLVMVGPTIAGRMLVVPIEPTESWGVWRPVTAFEANRHHRTRYERPEDGT
ncbi:MAG: BrnT family toxin [Chloroflexi bacterium]|nr:BrnT family toxin [Chloroflexota bacterium]